MSFRLEKIFPSLTKETIRLKREITTTQSKCQSLAFRKISLRNLKNLFVQFKNTLFHPSRFWHIATDKHRLLTICHTHHRPTPHRHPVSVVKCKIHWPLRPTTDTIRKKSPTPSFIIATKHILHFQESLFVDTCNRFGTCMYQIHYKPSRFMIRILTIQDLAGLWEVSVVVIVTQVIPLFSTSSSILRSTFLAGGVEFSLIVYFIYCDKFAPCFCNTWLFMKIAFGPCGRRTRFAANLW